jgi:hypothetical protein
MPPEAFLFSLYRFRLPITFTRKPDETFKLPAATIRIIGNNIRSRAYFVLIPPRSTDLTY